MRLNSVRFKKSLGGFGNMCANEDQDLTKQAALSQPEASIPLLIWLVLTLPQENFLIYLNLHHAGTC